MSHTTICPRSTMHNDTTKLQLYRICMQRCTTLPVGSFTALSDSGFGCIPPISRLFQPKGTRKRMAEAASGSPMVVRIELGAPPPLCCLSVLSSVALLLLDSYHRSLISLLVTAPLSPSLCWLNRSLGLPRFIPDPHRFPPI